ncbi:hypothetical protein EAW55_06050 [Legionella jordanis]|uniref:Transmembrane protein n=1 Tax=Legionella jordanis TaxID=456 RepID=A0A0W0V8S9_9GAMM|nr:hypothetical protein Ljor_0848 [Legionella jordanis]RMX03918.1 hypothetical protein EAW55_06050 [Legionella jordanis]RMX22016.1 hypothetical protein EAS68_00360 [Legionella jordanis]VEH11996.1 Uncharacterised protein [Legionella jordanis]
MSSRKQIQNSIKLMESNIRIERAKLEEHKHYFQRLKNRHQLLLAAIFILPTFIGGWQEGKKVQSGQGMKRFGKFLLATTFSTLRQANSLKFN